MTFSERLPLVNWLREALEIREQRVAADPEPQPHPTLFFVNDGSTLASRVKVELESLCDQWPIHLFEITAGTEPDELLGRLGAGVVTGNRGWAKLSAASRNHIRLCTQKFVHGYRKVPFDELIFKVKELP